MEPRIWLLPATIAAILLGVVPQASADEFYKGKTVTFVVGFSAGGGFDTYTRLIGRHIAKHIPGNPTIVVENRTGAGSLIAANYIYNQAPRDGTVIGNWIGPLVLQQVLGLKAAKFDGRRFGWLGAPTPDSGRLCVDQSKRHPNDGRLVCIQATDKDRKHGARLHHIGCAQALQAALGLPIKIVEGYKGTAKVRLAAQSGEVDGGCWAWESIKPTWANDLQSGEVHIVLQTTAEPHPDLKNVPLAIRYAKTDEARALLGIASGPYAQGARPFSVPPGVPQDRLQLLQKAFLETLRDPELLAEAKKSQLDIEPIDGPTMAKLMASLYDLSPALKTKLAALLIPGGQKKF